MDFILSHLQALFKHTPEIALFLSLALGYYVGKIHFGKFQLGGVAGSLLAAVIISQVGVTIDNTVKNILFALFIYAVGYTSGPQFFRSLGKKTIREIIMAAVLAVTGLATVIILAKIFVLDKGLAAGIAAGGLTQSAIIGTAGDALAKMGQLGLLAADEVKRMQENVGIGYAVTYVFGSFGTIIVCVNVLPRIMGRGIREDAIKAEANEHQLGEVLVGEGQQLALAGLVGRLCRVDVGQGKTVADIESLARGNSNENMVTVEKVKRKNTMLPVMPDLVLQKGDQVLLVGRRAPVLQTIQALGRELNSTDGMEMIIQTRDVVVSNDRAHNKTVGELRQMATNEMRHGIYMLGIHREGQTLPMTADTVIEKGDVVTIYGAEQDVRRVAAVLGYAVVSSDKTDFVYLGAGLVVGLLIGLLAVNIGGIPITLGSGGGALLSGLLFGWFRSRHLHMGSMPDGAAQLLKDLGLAGFVAVVGLGAGLEAVETIKAQGLTIFVVGMLVTIIPLIITMLIGIYVLRYDNAAVLAGALSGSRSANPAFGEVLNKAENSVPTVPFAITYALANVFLTLLGPLVVALA